MAVSLIFFVLAICFSGIAVYVFIASSKWADGVNKIDLGNVSKLKQSSFYNVGLHKLLRNGIPFLLPLANKMLKNKRINSFVSSMVEMLNKKSIFCSPATLLSLSFLIATFIFLFSLAITRTLIFGLAIIAFIIAAFVIWDSSAKDRAFQKMQESIPELLRSMASCFQTGYSLLQTFEHIEQEDSTELGKLFGKCAHVLQTGGTSKQALEILQSQEVVPQLRFVAVALDIQHQTGGSMSEVLNSARTLVENELAILSAMRVQTAQAKLSARVVSILPFGLIAVFSLVSPGFLTPFFSSFVGLVMLAVAIGMQALGIILVRRILKV